jgi:MFS family permease
MTELKTWHRAIVLLFSIAGLTGASFMVRLPLVRELLQVNNQQLGLILLAFSMGALSSLIFVGKIISRIGTKPVIIVGFVVASVAAILQVTMATNHSVIGLAFAGFFSGFATGAADVAINVDGAEIEKRIGKSSLPRMHAAFSIGAFSGAMIGTVAAAIDFPFFWQITLLAILSLVITGLAIKYLPSNIGKDEIDEASLDHTPAVKLINSTVILLALGILCVTIAEGAANDWIALAIVDDYKAGEANAGITYAIAMFGMTATRFFGGGFVDRYGKGPTLRVMISLGVVGVLVMIFGGQIWLAWIGAALWGIGVALGFPLFISAAAEQEHGPRKVAFVTTFGYVAFLVGPPLLGFLGQWWGLLNMFFLIATFLVVAWFASGSAGKQKLHEKTNHAAA